jgi:hypothetical protein
MNSEPALSIAHSLQTYLNPTVFHATGAERISSGLKAGKLVVVRNALSAPFAERMFNCLDRFADWKLYESYSAATAASDPGEPFRYHHHNIYDKAVYPKDLTSCQGIFASEETKRFIAQLSGQDCSGGTSFSASWYQPGDHSCPHNDHVRMDSDQVVRTVAFVWHLAKDWRPDWGGALYWCPTLRYVPPSFNTLTFFVVTDASTHFVTHVSPHARTKRLAINGWWSGRNAARGLRPIQEQAGEADGDIEII